MARDQEDFQRARRPEQKLLRHAAILAAALELAKREGIRNISLADIAAEVGMHKTALLRYFETREDIYLHLAIDAWRDWTEVLEAKLKQLGTGDVQGIAKAFSQTLNDRPFLCDLFSHLPLNLERNVSTTTLFGFKLAAYTAVWSLAGAVHLIIPEVPREDCVDMVGAVTAIAAMLWQVAHPPEAVIQLYVENPEIAHSFDDFAATINRLTETLILGLQAKNTR